MADICASMLIESGWLRPRELAALPREQWRLALIGAMEWHGAGDIRRLRTRLNGELALTARIHLHLGDRGIGPGDLAAMNEAARRDALLAELHERRGTPLEAMRDCDDRRLLAIAATGHLRKRLDPLVAGLENIGAAAPVAFRLSDNGGRAMDALKVLPIAAGGYLGIYHTWVDDAFRLQVARSGDLVEWTRIADLGEHEHQGDIKPMGGGFLVVSERDEPHRGNRLRFRYYESLEKLASDSPAFDRMIPRTLSRLNEGTPDIRDIEGEDPAAGAILVGFHYYRRNGLVRKVDRQALGVLSGFERWTAWEDATANQAIAGLGFRGNYGGRYSFAWQGESWRIQEAQQRWKDWSSWRVLLGDGLAFIELKPHTPAASVSFANPCLIRLDESSYAATFFLPRQGNVPGEDGELIFRFQTG